MERREFLAATTAALAMPAWKAVASAAAVERHLIYAATPGIRNYMSYGGIGVLVFDASDGHKMVKRIPTWPEPANGQEAENVKGVAANAKTGRLYVSTTKRIGCIDLSTEKMVWDQTYEGGCDRIALSPDGRTIYAPSFEGPHWTVIDAISGKAITTLEGMPALYAKSRGTAAAAPASLHPLQQAWIDVQVPHCGYCQNGMMIQAADLLATTKRPTEAQIRTAMNGHLCRCGTYPRILTAIQKAAAVMAKGGK